MLVTNPLSDSVVVELSDIVIDCDVVLRVLDVPKRVLDTVDDISSADVDTGINVEARDVVDSVIEVCVMLVCPLLVLGVYVELVGRSVEVCKLVLGTEVSPDWGMTVLVVGNASLVVELAAA